MICAGCNRQFKDGDRYIIDSASGFLNQAGDGNPEIDSLIAGIFGSQDGKVRFCENCTRDGGTYQFRTYHGVEDES